MSPILLRESLCSCRQLRGWWKLTQVAKLSTNIHPSSNSQILNELQEIWKTGNVPEYFNFSRDIFDRHVKDRPNGTALWFENDANEVRKWTFASLQAESIRSSIFLKNMMGIKESENETQPFLLTILPRVPEFWFLHLASIRTGSIFSPGTTMLTYEDIQYRLEASKAKMIITDEKNVDKVEKAAQSLNLNLQKVVVRDPDSKASNIKKGWIDYNKLSSGITNNEIEAFRHSQTKSEQIAQAYFTSGTTGKPKMVAHSHASYGLGHYTTCRIMDLRAEDVLWNISDPGWAKSSYSNFFAPWTVGSTVYIHQMEKFEPRKVLEVLSQTPITSFCAPPTLYKGLIQVEDKNLFKFPALRYSVGGGEPMNAEVKQVWFQKTGIVLDEIYGQTEMSAIDCSKSMKNNSIGIADGFFDIRIVDDNLKECPPGQEGQIALKVKPTRPVGLFAGYLRKGLEGPEFDTEKNDSVFIHDYYLTGDRAYKDETGHVFIIGRGDDVITSSGYRIGPAEVESVLQMHPGVVESAVVASPDPTRNEVVKAFIILTPEYKAKAMTDEDKQKLVDEIKSYVKEHTAPYKYPRKVEFVDSLPKTISGKILRRELKKMEFERHKNQKA